MERHQIHAELKEITRILRQLVVHKAVSATLIFLDEKGEPLVPATIHVNGNGATAAFTEFDMPGGTGDTVPPIGPVVFASDNTAVATVDNSGNCAAVGAGTCNISATDQGNGLVASDVLTVVAGTAVSATLVLTANP